MSGIDYSALPFPKNRPAVLERHAKRVKADRELDQAYAVVDARDGKVCQVRGAHLSAGHANPWKRLERHHLDSRSTNPKRRADPDCILTVSGAVHDMFESASLFAVDSKGRETRNVSKIAGYRWNRRMVAAGKEPFRLRNTKESA